MSTATTTTPDRQKLHTYLERTGDAARAAELAQGAAPSAVLESMPRACQRHFAAWASGELPETVAFSAFSATAPTPAATASASTPVKERSFMDAVSAFRSMAEGARYQATVAAFPDRVAMLDGVLRHEDDEHKRTSAIERAAGIGTMDAVRVMEAADRLEAAGKLYGTRAPRPQAKVVPAAPMTPSEEAEHLRRELRKETDPKRKGQLAQRIRQLEGRSTTPAKKP